MQPIVLALLAFSVRPKSVLLKNQFVVTFSENSDHVWIRKYDANDKVLIQRIVPLQRIRGKPVWQSYEAGVSADEDGEFIAEESWFETLRLLDSRHFLSLDCILTLPKTRLKLSSQPLYFRQPITAIDQIFFYQGRSYSLPYGVRLIPSEGKDIYAFDSLSRRVYRFKEANELVHSLDDRFLLRSPCFIFTGPKRHSVVAALDNGSRFVISDSTGEDGRYVCGKNGAVIYPKLVFDESNITRVERTSWGYIIVGGEECLAISDELGPLPSRGDYAHSMMRIIFSKDFAIVKFSGAYLEIVDGKGYRPLAYIRNLRAISFAGDPKHVNLAIQEGSSTRIYFNVELGKLASIWKPLLYQ